MKDTNAIEQERQRRGAKLATEMREALEPRTATEVAAAFVAHTPDVMSLPPLPPSPAEVGDLIMQTREHVQALGWGNREQLYTASQVRAVMSECAILAAARERKRLADDVADAERLRAALRQLVDVEDMRLRLRQLHEMGHGTDYTDYHRLLPLAWAVARDALGPNVEVTR